MINRERTIERNDAPPRGLADGGDAAIERITAHFWVGNWLYEVDYDMTARADGRKRFVRVQDSERRCDCPGRDDAEQNRRDHGLRHAAVGSVRPVSAVGR
jgi:hypothetical protein